MEKEQTAALGPDSEMSFICVATFLPLRSWKYMFSFQLMTRQVLKQIKQSEGIVNYAVKANFPKKHFWTFSIWKDKVSLHQFTSQEPHATLSRNLKYGLAKALHLWNGLARA